MNDVKQDKNNKRYVIGQKCKRRDKTKKYVRHVTRPKQHKTPNKTKMT